MKNEKLVSPIKQNRQYNAIALREIALLYRGHGAYQKAMDYYLKALALFQELWAKEY